MSYGTKYTVLPPGYARNYETFDADLVGRWREKNERQRRIRMQNEAWADKTLAYINQRIDELFDTPSTEPIVIGPIQRRSIKCKSSRNMGRTAC